MNPVKRSQNTTTVIKLFHPVYDLYQPDPTFDVQTFKEKLGLKENVFLYFGFIRKYKGLHNAIQAFKRVADQRNDGFLLDLWRRILGNFRYF